MDKNKRNELGAAWRNAVALTTLGWDLAIPIFGGVLLGHQLDRRLGAGYGFTLGLLALGVVTGFYNVIRSIQRMEAREKRRAVQEETELAE
jgi:predicted F0F1-ATPase subunit